MTRLVNRRPGRGAGWLLGLVPFIALLCTYLVGSHIRMAANPDDKLLPTPATIASTMHSYALEEDVRSGEVLFWVDTLASLRRIAIALVLSATIGLILGLAIGTVKRHVERILQKLGVESRTAAAVLAQGAGL